MRVQIFTAFLLSEISCSAFANEPCRKVPDQLSEAEATAELRKHFTVSEEAWFASQGISARHFLQAIKVAEAGIVEMIAKSRNVPADQIHDCYRSSKYQKVIKSSGFIEIRLHFFYSWEDSRPIHEVTLVVDEKDSTVVISRDRPFS